MMKHGDTAIFGLRSLGLLLLAALLGACAVGPNFVPPAPPTTTSFTAQPLDAATEKADDRQQHFLTDAQVPSDWWKLFKCPPLDEVVRTALINNPNLQASESSLRQSQDSLRAGYGVFFPQIQATAAATRERTAPKLQGSGLGGSIFNVFTLSGTVSYALDVFGGERRAVESLRAQALAQNYSTAAAYLTLSTNVVNTLIARAAYSDEIETTEELIQLQNQQLVSTQVEYQAGTVPYSAVLAIKEEIATNQSTLPQLKQSVSQTEDLLATFEGVVPSQALLPEIHLTDLSLPLDLPVNLPSKLVQQRPDILNATALLHVASAKIGVATAAMFPSFNLSGTLGAGGTNVNTFSAATGKFWSIGPTVTAPVFQGTTLWYGRKAAIDTFQEMQANYRQTVLTAFAQVADTLQALQHDAEALQAQVDGRRAAGDSLKLLQTNYQAGLVPDLDVLASDVLFHEATLTYLQALAQRHQDTAALFMALGGGWWNNPPELAESGKP